MKTIPHQILTWKLIPVTLVLGSLLAGALPAAPTEQPPDKTAMPTEITRDQRIQWWREARFGMFIHWGLYAIPGGVWKDKVHPTGYSEWIMFDEKIPAIEYARLAGKFNPEKFDAAAWTAIAKKAGMKYMVLTAKHHDGFSMFQSALTPYNIADATPFKRDVTRELTDACRSSGLRFGCYYSVDRDWFRPLGPGNRYKQNNLWDFPDSKQTDFDRYFDGFAKPQVEELLTKYRPDILWFDGIDMMNDIQIEALYRSIRKLRPECVINSRIQGCRFPDKIPPPHCDYISTGDNEIADKTLAFDWENPGTINTSYGFNRNDHNWVSAKEVVSRLVEIVSKGGNYLLNVGPTAEGEIPAPSIERLKAVGAWMQVNGKAIYATSASPFRKLPWGRCTKVVDAEGTTLNLLVFDWPQNGKLLVPGLTNVVEKAWLLANKQGLPTQPIAEGVEILVPAAAPDPTASVVVLRVRGEVVTAPLIVTADTNGVVALLAEEATLKGELKTESAGFRSNIGYWLNPADTASWDVKAKGKFKITIEAGSHGASQLVLQAGKNSAKLNLAPATGDYKKYKKYALGTIELTGEGVQKLVLKAVQDKWQPVNVREVRLTPVP